MSKKMQDRTWDTQALTLSLKQADPDLMEFDHSFWSMLKVLSENERDYCAKTFGFCEETIDALIESDVEDLYELASGEMLSFTVFNDENEIIKKLNEPCKSNIITKILEGSRYPIVLQYWNLAKRFAQRSDNDDENLYDVSLQFGLSLDLLRALRNCTDNQIFNLVETVDTTLGLRFDESIIHRILKCYVDKKNNINVLTILKYQQIVSSSIGLNCGREMAYSFTNVLTLRQLSAKDSDDNKKLSKNSLVRTLLARYLLISGAAVNIVQIETGFTQKNIYRLRNIIQKEGLKIENNRSKSQMSSVNIITNINRSIQASLLMILYYFHSESYENEPISKCLNLIPLLRAYRTYRQIMNVTSFNLTHQGNVHTNDPINLSECWTLAREMRSNEACILKSTKYRCYYFSSEHQVILGDCPFDSPSCENNYSENKSVKSIEASANLVYLKNEQGDYDVPDLSPTPEIIEMSSKKSLGYTPVKNQVI